jgi:hypothetical protein
MRGGEIGRDFDNRVSHVGEIHKGKYCFHRHLHRRIAAFSIY